MIAAPIKKSQNGLNPYRHLRNRKNKMIELIRNIQNKNR